VRPASLVIPKHHIFYYALAASPAQKHFQKQQKTHEILLLTGWPLRLFF
jgi:hypothetical protein